MFPKPTLAPLPPELCWECVRVAPGEHVEGLLAGEVQEVACHWTGSASKPCHRFISEGKLPCACDFKPMSLRVVVYVPIYTKERKKVVVPAAPSVGVKLQGEKPGTPIRLARPNKPKAALNVIKLSPSHLGEDWVKRAAPAMCFDICEYLLHLWQDAILCVHFGVEHRPAKGVVYPKEPMETTA